MDQENCQHAWVAGIMVVHPEDLESTARERAKWGGTVECEKCDLVYEVES